MRTLMTCEPGTTPSRANRPDQSAIAAVPVPSTVTWGPAIALPELASTIRPTMRPGAVCCALRTGAHRRARSETAYVVMRCTGPCTVEDTRSLTPACHELWNGLLQLCHRISSAAPTAPTWGTRRVTRDAAINAAMGRRIGASSGCAIAIVPVTALAAAACPDGKE